MNHYERINDLDNDAPEYVKILLYILDDILDTLKELEEHLKPEGI